MKNILEKMAVPLLLFVTSCGYGQQTLNTSSHSTTMHDAVFEYSIGEMTLINTFENKNLIVTQGFLQPEIKGTLSNPLFGSQVFKDFTQQIRVYPNPTDDILFIETGNVNTANFSFQLFDAVGKLVLSQSKQQIIGPTKLSVSLAALASGTYHLIARMPNLKGLPENLSFKIQKLH
jgi:hypothetical protein